MWALVADPCHVDYCSHPEMAAVLRELARYDWADKLFGHWSLTAFAISAGQTKQDPRIIVCIEYDPEAELFMLGICTPEDECYSGMENGHWVRKGHWEAADSSNCAESVDRIVQAYIQQFGINY